MPFLVPPGFHYVALQWGIWRAGEAVPLSLFHPRPEWHMCGGYPARRGRGPSGFVQLLRPIARERGLRFGRTTEALDPGRPDAGGGAARRAMIVYTSGTTGTQGRGDDP